MNPRLLRRRARIVRALRAFFDHRDFVEIEAPIAVRSPGMEPHLDAFRLQTGGARRYLHTSPEYALKRLLGAGFERIYSLGPCFRDEPPSKTHSPEFTMLEWYAVGSDLPQLMDQTEALIRAARAAVGRGPVGYRGRVTRVDGPFERLTVQDAFVRYAGVDPFAHPTAEGLRAAARAQGHYVADGGSWDDVFFQIHLEAVEHRLGVDRPTFLWGWPASQAALARLDAGGTRALRFELYAGGFELANAFDELTDADEQRARFEAEQAERKAAGKPVYPIDEPLLAALRRMSPTAGIALGVDRLVMWLTGAEHIADVRVQQWDAP